MTLVSSAVYKSSYLLNYLLVICRLELAIPNSKSLSPAVMKMGKATQENRKWGGFGLLGTPLPSNRHHRSSGDCL